MVKTLRYLFEGPGTDSRCCHWGFFSVVPPDRNMCPEIDSASEGEYQGFLWGIGGRCVWLTNYHHCSAEMSWKSWALICPEPLEPPRPVAGHLYFFFNFYYTFCVCVFSHNYPARNTHAPLPVCTIFVSSFSHKRHDFSGKYYWIWNLFWFFPKIFSEIYFILKKCV